MELSGCHKVILLAAEEFHHNLGVTMTRLGNCTGLTGDPETTLRQVQELVAAGLLYAVPPSRWFVTKAGHDLVTNLCRSGWPCHDGMMEKDPPLAEVLKQATDAQAARDEACPISRGSILTELAGIVRRPSEDLCRPQCATEERRFIILVLERLSAWAAAEIPMVSPGTDPRPTAGIQAARVRELAGGLRDFADIIAPLKEPKA